MNKNAKKVAKAEPNRKKAAKRPSYTKIQRMARELNMESVDGYSYDDAIDAFVHGDGKAFALSAYSGGGTLAIVAENCKLLKERGMYESALVHGYIWCKTDHSTTETDTIQYMFDWTDRDKLRAVGAPLPGPGPITVYRGVGRKGDARQVDGMSWTGSLDVACWFARKGGHDPAVYQATVSADEVYCYYNGRGEEEFICRPKESKRLPLNKREIGKGADRCAEARKARRAREQERLKQVASKAET